MHHTTGLQYSTKFSYTVKTLNLLSWGDWLTDIDWLLLWECTDPSDAISQVKSSLIINFAAKMAE